MTENGTETRNWQETQHIDDLWEDEMIGVEVEGKKVLLVNAGGEVRAYENRCPHQAWPLDEGDLDEGRLTCVNHMWTFDALTGAGINPCDHALKAFPCRVDIDGMIEVDLG